MKIPMVDRLATGETLIGVLNDITDPVIVELAAQGGFDYVMLEYEHGLRSLESIQHLIRAAEAAGVDTIVRIGEINTNLISRVLEAGATGLMVAHVKTREDAEIIARAAHYPPDGTRGQGYVRRGKLWRLGPQGLADDREANRRVVVIITIEDIEGVENIESILEVKGITGFALGVADLAASMGNLELGDPRVTGALDKVKQAIRRRGVHHTLDLVVDPAKAGDIAATGSQLLMFNHDVILIGDYFEGLAQGAKRSVADAAKAKS